MIGRRALAFGTATIPLARAQDEPAVLRGVRALLAAQVNEGREAPGMIVGLTGGGQRLVAAHGQIALPDGPAPDAATRFQIGSLTKVFTALLLAEMAGRDELAMEDPVARHLPGDWHVPERDGIPIRLIDLATHTSGLPRMPANFSPGDPGTAYAAYTPAMLRDGLAQQEPQVPPGSRYLYSNFGISVLGEALMHRSGRDYAGLLRDRILAPLGLSRTALQPEGPGPIAVGHTALLEPTPPWRFDALAPAGGLWSTTDDMLAFIEAAQGTRPTPLAPAFARLLSVRRPMPGSSAAAAAGWLVLPVGSEELVWMEGATGGFASMAGFSPTNGRGVVVLANAATWAMVPVLGRHLLAPALPAPPVRRGVVLTDAQLDRLVGRYALSPSFTLTVTRQRDQLLVQATGQPQIPVYATDHRRFFYRVVDAWLEFDLPEQGPAPGLVLHQAGRVLRARRVE